MSRSGPRERYREQTRAEAKEIAWEQIAEAGAPAISLNAIGKRLGMTGQALYRYFANRDHLITELITDAYGELAEVVDRAAGSPDPGERLASIARAMRGWALAAPHRYLLIYGTPVPGYHAPPETTQIAGKLMAVILEAVAGLDRPPAIEADVRFRDHLAEVPPWSGDGNQTPAVRHHALVFWTRVHGVISLEVSGHFEGMAFDPALLFEAEVARLCREIPAMDG